jgi:methylmalonyl-CoA mutase N-terminal domain/subunit
MNIELSDTPGEYPFTSGIHTDGYRSKSWNVMQYSGFGSASEANSNFHRLLNSGANGISIAFDLPTQMGISPASHLGSIEYGKVGVSIESLDDMNELLKDIDLERIHISMTINATAPMLLLLVQLVAEKRGYDPTKIRGTIQNDILKEFISRNTFIFPPKESINLTSQIFQYCQRELPLWNPISVSGYHFEEAGATSAQEVGFAISNAIEYLRSAKELELDLELLASKFTFFFSSTENVIEQVCKFRAARTIWAYVMKNDFGFTNTKTQKMRIHAQTAGSELTYKDPINNVARTTLQALGAVLGGVQSLHTNSLNEAYSIPTELTSGIAMNIQHIIQHETDITQYIDVFEGSKVITELTAKLALEIKAVIDVIESYGGARQAVEKNIQKSLIEQNAYSSQLELDSGQKRVIGVNFGLTLPKQEDFTELHFNSGPNKKNLAGFTLGEPKNSIASALEYVEKLRDAENKLYPIKQMLSEGYTVSQISEILKIIYGEYKSLI